uniref:Uncharacterized protein n=1 Tax=Cacopsylla melanoneura TaxID=428564 RepID=A0A8D9FID0_9HEMI
MSECHTKCTIIYTQSITTHIIFCSTYVLNIIHIHILLPLEQNVLLCLPYHNMFNVDNRLNILSACSIIMLSATDSVLYSYSSSSDFRCSPLCIFLPMCCCVVLRSSFGQFLFCSLLFCPFPHLTLDVRR